MEIAAELGGALAAPALAASALKGKSSAIIFCARDFLFFTIEKFSLIFYTARVVLVRKIIRTFNI